MGLAAAGVVMVLSFRSKLEVIVPDKVRASLPQRLLDSVKQNPQALLDPAAAGSLKGHLAEAGAEDVQMVDRLLDSLNAALVGGLGDAFTVACCRGRSLFRRRVVLPHAVRCREGAASLI